MDKLKIVENFLAALEDEYLQEGANSLVVSGNADNYYGEGSTNGTNCTNSDKGSCLDSKNWQTCTNISVCDDAFNAENCSTPTPTPPPSLNFMCGE